MARQRKQEVEIDESPSLPSTGRSNLIVCLLLALVTLSVFNSVNQHPFVNYDDDRYVTENPHIRQGLSADTIKWAFTSTDHANWHPVTWLSHARDVSLFRMNPAGHHLTSVAIHVANAVLVYLLLVAVTGRMWPSLFVALLFALHPIQVESVAWIAERKNVLCTLFFLLTVWAYGRYARQPSLARYVVIVVAFALALMSKPMVITLPFVLLLLDYWPLGRIANWTTPAPAFPVKQSSFAKLLVEKIPLFVMSFASALITISAQQTGGAMRSTTQFSFGVRLANAIHAYAMYLWKMIWPAKLAPLYPHPGDSLNAGQIIGALFVLLGITVLVLKFREKRYLLAGWLFFLGTLIPVIGLIQVGDQAMADRYAYIPLLGIFAMITFTAADIAQRAGEKQIAGAANVRYGLIAAGAVALIALIFMTRHQIGFWETSTGLWSHTLAVTENNYIAEDNLGGALVIEGKIAEAHAHFVRASEINPRDPMSQLNLGAWQQEIGNNAQAIEHYRRTTELTSDKGLVSSAYTNMGTAYRHLGDFQKARDAYMNALYTNSNQGSAWVGLGIIAEGEGKLDEAIRDLAQSIGIQPTPDAYVRLGRVFERTGHLREARNAYEEALKLDPHADEAQKALDALPHSNAN